MDAHELTRIRELVAQVDAAEYPREYEAALRALGAEVPALLAHIDRQQQVIQAARAVVGDVTAANWYEDAFTYIVDAEALETLRDEVDGMGNGG